MKELKGYSEEKTVIRELLMLSEFTEEDIYVEVGTREGKSLLAAVDGNDKMQIISIDKHQLKPTKARFASRGIRFIEADSHKAYKQLRNEGVEISSIFIDGNHEQHYVQRDIIDYWKLWNGKGFFGGHDFTKRKGYGVIQAVREFFGIDTMAKVNRRWKVKGGVLHVCHTVWFFIKNEELSKYRPYLRKL